MDKYTSDETVIASAQNDVVRGEKDWGPTLCGLGCTWRQRRLHETAFYAALGHKGFAETLDRFRFGVYLGQDGRPEA